MTEYQINQILKEQAANAGTSDYTDRELNEDGSKVTCFCSVTSQVFNTLYPRYTVTWKTSKEDGYIQAAYHFRAGNTSFARIAKIFPSDGDTGLVESKIYSALVSGFKRGKEIYDGDVTGPWHADYQHPTAPPEEG